MRRQTLFVELVRMNEQILYQLCVRACETVRHLATNELVLKDGEVAKIGAPDVLMGNKNGHFYDIRIESNRIESAMQVMAIV